MEPGDMVLYESHSIIHGRPFALKGKFYANLFIHFAPDKVESGIPSYIIEGSPEDVHMRQTNGYDNLLNAANGGDPNFKTTDAHVAAQSGNIKSLTRIAEREKELLYESDSNGWTPIAEAARFGKMEAVKFLLEHGADVRTMTFSGHNVLEIAAHSKQDEVLKYLQSYAESNNLQVTIDPTLLKNPEQNIQLELEDDDDHDAITAQIAAHISDLEALKKIANKNKELLYESDSNGWTPIHEAARAGNVHVIKFLIHNGSNLEQKTGNGETALAIAYQFFSEDHEAVKFLKSAVSELL